MTLPRLGGIGKTRWMASSSSGVIVMVGRQVEQAAVEPKHAAVLRLTQRDRAGGNGVEDWLNVRWRARNEAQDVARCRLLCSCLGQLSPRVRQLLRALGLRAFPGPYCVGVDGLSPRAVALWSSFRPAWWSSIDRPMACAKGVPRPAPCFRYPCAPRSAAGRNLGTDNLRRQPDSKGRPCTYLLSTVTSPPIIRQNCLVIASPSPVHPNWRAVEASACATPGTAWPCVRGSTDTGIADAEGDPLAPSLRLACNRQRHHPVPGKLAGVAKLLQLRPRRASYGSLCPYAIR